jgi:hypothetical protein
MIGLYDSGEDRESIFGIEGCIEIVAIYTRDLLEGRLRQHAADNTH